MRNVSKIIIHCTATCEGKNYDVAEIRRWHLKRGFTDIGYHFLIHLDGKVEVGRPLHRIGAHTSGQNSGSIGVCYAGGVEAFRTDGKYKAKDTRTQQQKDSLVKLITELIYEYNKDMTIHGHNEFANKACPCFNVKEEYANL